MKSQILLKSVTKNYDAHTRALNNISLKISKGEWVSIIGPSGSGKTTFLNLIGGLDTPDSGSVVIDNDDLKQLKDKILSKLINFDFENKAKMLIEEQLNTLIKLPIKVHPDLVKPLKVIFDSRFEHGIINAIEIVNGFLKKAELSLSFFHHGALTETGVATMGLGKMGRSNINIAKSYFTKKKPILENFEEVFRLGLFKSLMTEGFAEPQVEYVLREHQHIVIAKTNSRSILGSMNDLAFQIKSMIYATGGLANADLSEINRQLNRIPMSAIKYKVSIDELKRLLADAGK